MSITTRLAKAVMKLREVTPDPANTGGLQEVFNLRSFREAPQAVRDEIMSQSSQAKYREEVEYPWDAYFDIDITALLGGKHALDLGCFNGGRGAAWYERYRLSRITGIDVDQVYIDAATRFAAAHGIRARYTVAQGETLPFPDASFDAILSFDVLEHVRSVSATMKECYRVLKPGGLFLLVFPSYFQPNEHHLGMVTRFPGIQCLFSGRTLIRAYSEILAERGESAREIQGHSARSRLAHHPPEPQADPDHRPQYVAQRSEQVYRDALDAVYVRTGHAGGNPAPPDLRTAERGGALVIGQSVIPLRRPI